MKNIRIYMYIYIMDLSSASLAQRELKVNLHVVRGNMLMHVMLGKHFSRHFDSFCIIFSQKKKTWHFMQIVSIVDTFHDVANSVF